MEADIPGGRQFFNLGEGVGIVSIAQIGEPRTEAFVIGAD